MFSIEIRKNISIGASISLSLLITFSVDLINALELN